MQASPGMPVLQGPIRMSRFSAFEAWVSSESAGEDIQVHGREAVNRALDGDIVALRLLTPAEAAVASKAAARRPKKGPAADPHPEASGDEEDEEPHEDSRVAEVSGMCFIFCFKPASGFQPCILHDAPCWSEHQT